MPKPKRHPAGGSKAGAAQRAHATRLLGTLLKICRQLRVLHSDPVAKAANRQVERQLLNLRNQAADEGKRRIRPR
jgi:hypothetical protein